MWTVTWRHGAPLAVNGGLSKASADRYHLPSARSRAFLCVPGGLVALEPMTTRPHRLVPTAVALGTSGGAGTTTIAVPLAVPTQPRHPVGRSALVDFDSGAFNILGQPPHRPPRRAIEQPSPIDVAREGS